MASLLCLALTSQCSNEGSSLVTSAVEDASALGASQNITGSISSQTGEQSDLSGWIVLLVEKGSQITRTSEISRAGLFSFPRTFMKKAYTIALLSPPYTLQAVLSYPSSSTTLVRQYFTLQSPTIPHLVHKGAIITFQTLDGIKFEKDLAIDSNSDGIPDGYSLLGASLDDFELTQMEEQELDNEYLDGKKLDLAALVDTDLDGIANVDDGDIDGDGLANVFDPDDDGDGILDIFDDDANGDLIADAVQGRNDLYFSRDMKWISVQYVLQSPAATGGKSSRYMVFSAQRSRNAQIPTPTGLQIRGATSLLTGATTEVINGSGAVVSQTWDRTLLDDGLSGDAASGDLLFSRKVLLDGEKSPNQNQILFFELSYVSGDTSWAQDFPYTFPNLSLSTINASYATSSRVVTMTGNPFGEFQTFTWTSSIYLIDADGKSTKVYTSSPVKGTERTAVIPNNILEAGKTYKLKVISQTLDRIPGYPSYSVESPLVTLDTSTP